MRRFSHFRRAASLGGLVAGLLGCGGAPIIAQSSALCDPGNVGLEVPDGFCVSVFADQLGRTRHMAVAPNGDLFVAVYQRDDGHVAVLRDTDGDGRADQTETFGNGPINEVKLTDGFVYYSTTTEVMRQARRPGEMVPHGEVEVVIRDLPTGGHRTKTMVFAPNGDILLSVGSRSNSCQVRDRERESPGHDPCTELETRAGIWRFPSDRLGQTQADGTRYASGLRNPVALEVHPDDGHLYVAVHGRDQLSGNWPQLFTDQENAEKPSEEFVRVEEGDRFGWPYCFHDRELGRLVLAPEYGGDGRQVGRCADHKEPLIGFPGHWAPLGLLFYTGDQFPQRYRGGAFLVFHGSWNRAPLPQGGYNVVFVPFADGEPTGEWQVFAEGFAGPDPQPRTAPHRPVDVVQADDGSLFISDDRGGRIYRISYVGT